MANRILLGNLGGTYGFWVSKPGFDVADTALKVENMLFSFANPYMRLLTRGTIVFTASSLVKSIPIPAGVNPVIRVFYIDSSGYLVESAIGVTEYGYINTATQTIEIKATQALTLYYMITSVKTQ